MTNLIKFITKKLDLGQFVSVIFLDIRKAFDSVNHKVLLKKLRKLNILKQYLYILESYLSNRKQFTRIGIQLSEPKNIKAGIVQGSRLGLSLFRFYINDIFQLVLHETIQLFADDGAIGYCADSLEELQLKM